MTNEKRKSIGQRVRGQAAALGLLHARTRVPLLVFVLVIIGLQVQRLTTWLVHCDHFQALDAGLIAKAFAVGLRFDLVIAGMFVVPLLPLMFAAPPALIARTAFKWSVAGLAGALLALLGLVLLADLLFFSEFGVRLNHQVMNYLPGAGNAYIYHDIAERYPIWLVAVAALAAGVALAWVVRRWGFDDRYNVGRLWHGIVWPTLFTALVVLAIRGTVSSHAINTGPAFFTPSMPLSQLTLNGAFTLRQAIAAHLKKQVDIDRLYDLPPRTERVRRVRRRVFSEGDRPMPDPVNPLNRLTPAHRPQRDINVVMVVLESMHWAYVGHLGGRAGLTPNLDALAEAGVHATHAYAVGGRTQRGFAGILAGFPDIPVASATTRNETLGNFLTLPALLKQRGYHTMFIYGGPGHRDHRQSFLGSNGVEEFIVEDDLSVRTFRTKLGYNDRDLLQSTIRILNRQPPDRPFFALLLTLTFHSPYTLPGSQAMTFDGGLDRQFAAVRFTDQAIGQFIEQARSQPWFDRTIFVFVADHGGGSLVKPKSPAMYRVPVIVYGPRIEGIEPRVIDKVRSQMDISPTVMGLLGGDYQHCFFGSDMLAHPAAPGYAMALTGSEEIIYYTAPDRAALIRPHGRPAEALRFDPESGRTIDVLPASEDDRRTAVSLAALAHELFVRQRFNVTPALPEVSPNH